MRTAPRLACYIDAHAASPHRRHPLQAHTEARTVFVTGLLGLLQAAALDVVQRAAYILAAARFLHAVGMARQACKYLEACVQVLVPVGVLQCSAEAQAEFEQLYAQLRNAEAADAGQTMRWLLSYDGAWQTQVRPLLAACRQ